MEIHRFASRELEWSTDKREEYGKKSKTLKKEPIMKYLFFYLLSILILFSCNKDEEDFESINDVNATYITHISVNIEVHITPHHQLSLDSKIRAEIYKENANRDTITSNERDYLFNCYSKDIGPAVIFMSNLQSNTTYKVRVFIDIYQGVNKIKKTLKGEEITFKTKETEFFIDPRDEQKYRIAEIGDKIWFLDNLRYNMDSKSWNVNNDKSLGGQFGLLYNYQGATEAIPKGWRLPSDKDWMDLERHLGIPEDELESFHFARGSKINGEIMEPGTNSWNDINLSTNQTGFTTKPAGAYFPSNYISDTSKANEFDYFGDKAFFWTSTTSAADNNYTFIRQVDKQGILRQTMNKNYGFSVRCVKDKDE